MPKSTEAGLNKSEHDPPDAKRRDPSGPPGPFALWLAADKAAGSSFGWRAAGRHLGPAVLALAVVVVIVFVRVPGADFVAYDDNIHVYANPFLNPLSWESLGKLWRQAYTGLYIPLAYTMFAGISLFARVPSMMSSVGQTVTLSPGPFHVASVAFHIVNALLCLLLAQSLTRSRPAALLCSFVFAVHPLQVESVSWISELRGLSSAFFSLGALNAFVLSRRTSDLAAAASRTWLGASAVLSICAMLCKPSALAIPLVALAIDRLMLGTSWRKSVLTALTGVICLLPLALITRWTQHIFPEGESLWWQRPFIAGDALGFYLFKTVVPTDLCVEYGRTPRAVMSQGWSYAVWMVPASLLVFSYVHRKRRPLTWLGSLMFVIFLLPTLGLLPFSFQAHSTVADRYAYLPMIGIGLVVADVALAIRMRVALHAASAVLVGFAILAFQQTSNWADNSAFVRHTIEVNPEVAFAQVDLGGILLREGLVDDAIAHLSKGLELNPDSAVGQNNLGMALVRVGRAADAEPYYKKAVELNPLDFKAYENLGQSYLLTDRPDAAIASFQAALAIQPSEAKALNDLGVAFMRTGRIADGLNAFQQAVVIEPNNAQYRRNVGYALMQQGRTDEARPSLAPTR
jgi:protein O-mannosyl-transferase